MIFVLDCRLGGVECWASGCEWWGRVCLNVDLGDGGIRRGFGLVILDWIAGWAGMNVGREWLRGVWEGCLKGDLWGWGGWAESYEIVILDWIEGWAGLNAGRGVRVVGRVCLNGDLGGWGGWAGIWDCDS